jgi:hypothetical protein
MAPYKLGKCTFVILTNLLGKERIGLVHSSNSFIDAETSFLTTTEKSLERIVGCISRILGHALSEVFGQFAWLLFLFAFLLGDR